MPYEAVTLQKNDHVVIINLFGLGIDRVKTEKLSHELSDLCEGITSNKAARSIFFGSASSRIETLKKGW